MHLLSRRLYNGGFNHLKCAGFLIYRTPVIVDAAVLGFPRLCSSASKIPANNDAQTEPSDYSTSQNPHRYYSTLTHKSMSVHRDFNKANEAYVANFGDKGRLALAPTKKLAIVTCMDARINPYAHLGINEGEAHIIRNAGGVAKDALRSIIISQRLLGTREIAVFHHTGCGMLTFTSSHLQTLVKDSDPGNPALEAVDKIDFLEFPDLEQSIKDDVAFLKENPLVLPETVVTGWVYEVETGKIRQIV